jgi:hypothetical protein
VASGRTSPLASFDFSKRRQTDSGREKVLPFWPDARRIELIKQSVDKAAFIGVALLGAFLALPLIDWDRFIDLKPGWMVAVMVGCLTPPLLFLLWLEQRIRNRRIRWTFGGLAWIALFVLALSGYHLP